MMSQPEPLAVRLTNRGLRLAEDVLYALVALLLAVAAIVVLVDAAHALITEVGDGATLAIEATLNSLLIVFILVELLGAVRETVRERKLIAEPFLLIGIIASIKEIVVVGGFAGEGQEVTDAMLKVGVLGAVAVSLSVAAYLLRRKEREPDE